MENHSGEFEVPRLASAAILILSSSAAFGQDSKPLPTFEVAEVKVNKTGSREVNGTVKNGQVSIRNLPMRILISEAFHVRGDAISGGPSWIDDDRFDIIAKATPDTSEDELRRMLQALLIERFKLAAHPDQKLMPAYALVVSKQGSKMQPAEPPKPGEQRCHPGAASPGDRAIECEHITTKELADGLQGMAPAYITMPVVDQTNLTGAFAFKLHWTPVRAGEGGRGGATADAAASDSGSGLTVFDALQSQLGLRLESKKLPLPIIVVEHVERVPTEN